MTGETVLTLPRTPKSLNQVGARGNPVAFHREKKIWEYELALMARAEDLPGWPTGPQLLGLKASALLRFASKRKRDEGNYRVLLEKALGDALQGGQHWPEGKWLPDDTPEYFSFEAVAFSAELGAPQTVLTLEWAR